MITLFSALVIVASVVLYLYSSRRTNCLSHLDLSKFFIAEVSKKKNYCKYYERARLGDYESFKKMLDFVFDAGANTEHGYVINSIIDAVGQGKIIEWIKKGEIDKIIFKSWIRGGVQWDLPNEYGERIWAEDKYPLLFEFFNSQNQHYSNE